MRAALLLAVLVPTIATAQDLSFREMRWRDIGPTRAGRARAVAGVPSQPNTFYAGFDNGGVWRSTDYGANWMPLFDDQSTGSIGAIAVAPSNPNVIYVGSGAGIIRPDLAIGNGMYKSTDAGQDVAASRLRDSQMIAAIAVDPVNADRLFVAVLGHPYGPNPERGVFRSTDGGRTFEKVLFKDDYTSANEVLLDPRNPNVLYATLWSQQQSFIEGQGFGNAGMGIFKSTDGGTTWTQLAEGFPPSSRRTSQSRRAIRTSSTPSSRRDRDRSASINPPTAARIGFRRFAARAHRPVGAGHAAARAHRRRRPADGDRRSQGCERRLHRVDVMWRTMDGGLTWSAVRGAPGGDDYQRIWINPNDRRSSSPSPIRARWCPRIAAAAGATGTTRTRRRCITSPPTTRFPIASARTAGLGQRLRAKPIG
jgi:hypothetical protein